MSLSECTEKNHTKQTLVIINKLKTSLTIATFENPCEAFNDVHILRTQH